jgi:hypothetical protein
MHRSQRDVGGADDGGEMDSNGIVEDPWKSFMRGVK